MAKFYVAAEPIQGTKVNGTRAVVVDAVDAAMARLLASSLYGEDSGWTDSTPVDLTAAFAATFVNFKYRFRVSGHAGQPDILDYTYTAGAETTDQAAASIVAALAAIGGPFVGAKYATPLLTPSVAAQGIGDHRLSVEITPAGSATPLASLVGAIVHNGIAAADLSVVLAIPAGAVIPVVGAIA